MAQYCDNFYFRDSDNDSFEFWNGLRGPYYTPHVGADGVLSWTNTGGLPNPAPVDISGPPGPGVELRGPVASVADLPATAPSGELWLVGAASPYDGWFYNGASWEDLGQISIGPVGPTGATPDLQIGTVSTGEPGSAAEASITGTPEEPLLNLKLPRGQQGPAVPLSDATPLPDGTASAGTGTSAAREDHVHQHDTTKQNVLTFDAKPTNGSTNPVTSTGIYNNTTISKLLYVRVSDNYTSIHLPNSCRAFGIVLDSTPARNGLYAFATTATGAGASVKLSSTGPDIINGQNKVTFDITTGGLGILTLFVPNQTNPDDVYETATT